MQHWALEMADFQSLKHELKAMFPSMDTEVIAAVLRESKNDADAAIEMLLEMSSGAPLPPAPSSSGTLRQETSLPPAPSSSGTLRQETSLPPAPSSSGTLWQETSLPPAPSSSGTLWQETSLPPAPSSSGTLRQETSLPPAPSSSGTLRQETPLPPTPSSSGTLRQETSLPPAPPSSGTLWQETPLPPAPSSSGTLRQETSLPPAPSSSGTLWQETPAWSNRPSNLTGGGQESSYHQSGLGTLGSLHPTYSFHTEYQPPYYYYAGPQQQHSLSSPSLYQDPSQSAMPNARSLYGSTAQPLASPRTAKVPVQPGGWPLVFADTKSSMQAATEDGGGQVVLEVKQLFLLRGLPGSGKSTLARKLVGTTGIICCTDDFFTVNGQYTFDPSKLGENHDRNKQRAREALQRGCSPVIIDNTNTAAWEMKPYVAMGLEYGYDVRVTEPETPWKFNVGELTRRNSHGVSRQAIERMLERYEKNLTVESILSSQQPPERREPLPSRGRVSGRPYSTPPLKRNASPRTPRRTSASSSYYRGNHSWDHPRERWDHPRERWDHPRERWDHPRERWDHPRERWDHPRERWEHPSTTWSNPHSRQAVWAAPPARDVWGLEDKKPTGTSVTAIKQSPPTQRANWESREELLDPTCPPPPTLASGAVSRVFLSPEQHSDSSFDDPAIVQKVHTATTPAEQEGYIAPSEPVHTDQSTIQADAVPIARIEDQLLELFPAAEDILPGDTPPGYVPLDDVPPENTPLGGVPFGDVPHDIPPGDILIGVPPSSSVLSVSDLAEQERLPTFTLGSPASDSGEYFPSGYLKSEAEEQDGMPRLVTTFDEQYPNDTTPSLLPVVEDPTFTANPPPGLSMSSPVIAMSSNSHDNTGTHYSEDDAVRDSAILGSDLEEEFFSVCSEDQEPLTVSDATYPPAGSIMAGDSHTAESGAEGEAGDLGFLKDCFPDLDASYLEQLYHHCGGDVEAAVSSALGYSYLHTSSEGGTEEIGSSVNTSSLTSKSTPRVQAATGDDDDVQDTKIVTQRVLEYLRGDLEGVTFGQLGREKFNVSETDMHPDCIDDEEIARQLQQELNLELQSSDAEPPGYSSERSPGPPPQPPEQRRTLPVKEGEAPDSDDNLVLKLTPSLARQLQEMFGSVTELLPLPGTMREDDLLVLLSERAASEIHKKWCDTLECKRNEYQFHSEKLLQDDSALAQELQEVEDGIQAKRLAATERQEASRRSASCLPSSSATVGVRQHHSTAPPSHARGGVSSLSEIIGEQFAEEMDNWEVSAALKTACQNNAGRKIQLNKLYRDFPQLSKSVIHRVLVQNRFNFQETAEQLKALVVAVDTTDGNTHGHKASPPHSNAKTRSHRPHPSSSSKKLPSSSPKKHPPLPPSPSLHRLRSPKSVGKKLKPDEEAACHPSPYQTLDKEQPPSYKDLRAEATLHAKLRAEAFQKAAHARSKRQGQIASYYAQQGHMHTEKMKEANRRAAELTLQLTNDQSSNSLDLHGLHVSEALEALQLKLTAAAKGEHVHVITGRGIHSKGREARIKPAVTQYLQQHGYIFNEPNAGMLRVYVK